MNAIFPQLKGLYSPDVDLDSYRPDEADCFGFLLQAFFGPSDGAGRESFDILVCTPKWLDREIGEDAQRCSAADWEEAARRLGQLGRWEFEDYAG